MGTLENFVIVAHENMISLRRVYIGDCAYYERKSVVHAPSEAGHELSLDSWMITSRFVQ